MNDVRIAGDPALTAVAEDYLAAIYLLDADGQRVIGARLAERLGVSRAAVAQTLRRLSQDGYVAVGERSSVRLTATGRTVAEAIVRRRRVVERWLSDTLRLDWTRVHQAAHRLEHVVSAEISERLYSTLGRPATCPHGHPIPGADLEPGGIPLDVAPLGTDVVVDRTPEAGEGVEELLAHLDEAGIRPGVRLRVVERAAWAGTVTVELRARRLVLGRDAAARIRVRPAAEDGEDAEAEPEVVASVRTVHGACRAGHRVGDRFDLGCRTPAGLCGEAFQVLYPLAKSLRVPGREDAPPAALDVACPEGGAVVFRVERAAHPSDD